MNINKRGISLIVLVITIIIMIIIAGAIIISLNGSGIIGRANIAKAKANNAVMKEKIYFALQNMQLEDGVDETKYGIKILENRGKNIKIVEDIETGIKYRVDLKNNIIDENYVANSLKNTNKAIDAFASYKDSIKTISFVKYINIPQDAINNDLSASQDRSIMGWLETNPDDPEKYDLYIGSNGTIIARNCDKLFDGWNSTEKIFFDNFDTYDVQNFHWMFRNCTSLKEINLSYLETSNATTLEGLLNNCTSLTGILDLSSWNIENVTNFAGMFAGTSVDEIIMPGKNSKVTTMQGMFQVCKAEKIDISGIDTTTLTSLNCTFLGCPNLKYLDVSSFNFKNITDWFGYLGYLMPSNIVVYVKDQESKNYLIDHKPNNLKIENIIIR